MMAVDRRSLWEGISYAYVICVFCMCSQLVFNSNYNKLRSMNSFKRHLIYEGNVSVSDIPLLPVSC